MKEIVDAATGIRPHTSPSTAIAVATERRSAMVHRTHDSDEMRL